MLRIEKSPSSCIHLFMHLTITSSDWLAAGVYSNDQMGPCPQGANSLSGTQTCDGSSVRYLLGWETQRRWEHRADIKSSWVGRESGRVPCRWYLNWDLKDESKPGMQRWSGGGWRRQIIDENTARTGQEMRALAFAHFAPGFLNCPGLCTLGVDRAHSQPPLSAQAAWQTQHWELGSTFLDCTNHCFILIF